MYLLFGVMRSSYGWLYRKDGFVMWLKRRFMLLRLYVSMNVSIRSVLVFSEAIKSISFLLWEHWSIWVGEHQYWFVLVH